MCLRTAGAKTNVIEDSKVYLEISNLDFFLPTDCSCGPLQRHTSAMVRGISTILSLPWVLPLVFLVLATAVSERDLESWKKREGVVEASSRERKAVT